MSALEDDWEEGFATGILPWDMPAERGGPRRGSLEDYGNALIVDVAAHKPDKLSMLYADLCNGLQRHAAAIDGCIYKLGISVTINDDGDPVVQQAIGPAAASVGASLTLTENGDGDVSITWAAGTFPATILEPLAGLNGDNDDYTIRAKNIVNGVRVVTRDSAPAGAWAPFTVLVF
jgi:hypothetical protein